MGRRRTRTDTHAASGEVCDLWMWRLCISIMLPARSSRHVGAGLAESNCERRIGPQRSRGREHRAKDSDDGEPRDDTASRPKLCG